MTTLRQLIRLWLLLRSLRASGPAAEWTESDEASMRGFWSSPIGRKLNARMTVAEVNACTAACARVGHTEYSCGYAAGLRAGFAWIRSLSASAPLQEDAPENVEETEAALLERHSA